MRMPLDRWLFAVLCSTGCAEAHGPTNALDEPTLQPDATSILDASISTVNVTSPAPGAPGATGDARPRPAPEAGPATVFRPDAALFGDARADDGTTDAAYPVDARAAPETPPDWRCVQGECGLRLCGPAGIVAIPSAGVDSCVASFRTLDCHYSGGIDFFSTESGVKDLPEYTVDYVRIDGLVTRLETYRSLTSPLAYWASIRVPPRPAGSSVAPNLSAGCKTPEARDAALRILQTLELARPSDGATELAPTTPDCTGFDERPLQGWLLGSACVGPKVTVPGVCAVGAKTNLYPNVGGDTRCIVSPQGDYLWAYVPYGEGVVTGPSGSRVDGVAFGPGQLSTAEFARCAELSGRLGTLDGGITDAAAGEPAYVRCP